MQSWNVFLDGHIVDTVYFVKDIDAGYVKNSLVNHDNFHPNISVVKAK